MSGKYFGPGNAPYNIDTSEAGQRALTQVQGLGYSVEYSQAGIRIAYQPPSTMQAFAYGLDDFLEICRSILMSHAMDAREQRANNGQDPIEKGPRAEDVQKKSVAQLVALSKKAIEQRDAWKSRAVTAERELAALKAQTDRGGNAEGRYGKLKRVIAQELHPDNQKGAAAKLIKAEIFKVVWSKVQDIEKEG